MTRKPAGRLLAFPEARDAARRLSVATGLPVDDVEVHRFPDGESRVRVPARLSGRVLFFRSLDNPNDKLVELLLAARTARDLGAQTVGLIAPYLCYMRQDRAFHPGEAISQRIIGSFLAETFDELVTVAPHLHRTADLRTAVPARRSLSASPAEAIALFLSGQMENPLLVGPDAESVQWVRAVAELMKTDFVIGEKQRLGDRSVELRIPDGDCRGRHVVLLDDVAITGRTIEAAALQLAARHPASMSALVIHAVFQAEALTHLERAGVSNIWTTDSIVHETNVIQLANTLASSVNGLWD